MAKATGLSWTTFNVGDSSNASTDIRNDITNLSFSTPRGVQDQTGNDNAANDPQQLLADFS